MPLSFTDDWAGLRPAVSRPLATVAWCKRTDQTVCQWFTTGSSWPTLWPLGNRMLQTAWLCPSGSWFQLQSQLRKGSLGGCGCVCVSVDSQPSITETVMTMTMLWLKRQPIWIDALRLTHSLDQRPEIITRSFPLCECKYHVMVSIQFSHLDTIKQWRVKSDALLLPVTYIPIYFLGFQISVTLINNFKNYLCEGAQRGDQWSVIDQSDDAQPSYQHI